MVDRLAFTQILRDGGCRSYKTSTCGLHIHTPKSAWTALALYKAMEFFRRNVDLITLIACRDGGNWASIESDHHEIKYRCKSKTGGARYRAINLTNSATVEFRIFRGTLAPEGIFRCLEFVDCFWRFCNAAGLSELTPGAFLVFLARNRRQYPNLAQFIARKMPVEFALRGGMPAGPVAPGAMAPAVELQAPAVEREIAQCV